MIGGVSASEQVISSDRFVIKILDRTISSHDIEFQERNLKALHCVYPESIVVGYFEKDFLNQMSDFTRQFPEEEEKVKPYLRGHEVILKKIRYYFKMLRYSEDQNSKVTPEISDLVRQGSRENKCGSDVLYKDTLKSNFISLLRLELYLRSRYGGQLKSSKRGLESIRPSLDLFVDSLDKQFVHEYFW